jgi:hypothetical protein
MLLLGICSAFVQNPTEVNVKSKSIFISLNVHCKYLTFNLKWIAHQCLVGYGHLTNNP